jgi:predicted dehydrogenase
MAANRQINLGLVGTGAWGLKYLPAAAYVVGVVLEKVASPNVALKTLPDHVTGYADWRDLLDQKLDGLVIASTPDSHAEIASAALGAGLPVLVEKPLTPDSLSSQTLHDLAKHKRAILQVGHIDLHNPALAAILVALPDPSEIQSLTGVWSNAGPYRPDTSPLWDWGPHPLACCLKILGADAQKLDASYSSAGEGGLYDLSGTIAQTRVNLAFGNGATARNRWLEIETADHLWRYDDSAVDKAKCDGQPMEYASTSALTAQVERFAQAIRLGQADYQDASLAVDVARLLEYVAEKTAS